MTKMSEYNISTFQDGNIVRWYGSLWIVQEQDGDDWLLIPEWGECK